MKLKNITYERLKSGPGFNNTKVGVTIDLEDGDDGKDGLEKAKVFVAMSLGEFALPDEVNRAQRIIDTAKAADDLPF